MLLISSKVSTSKIIASDNDKNTKSDGEDKIILKILNHLKEALDNIL